MGNTDELTNPKIPNRPVTIFERGGAVKLDPAPPKFIVASHSYDADDLITPIYTQNPAEIRSFPPDVWIYRHGEPGEAPFQH